VKSSSGSSSSTSNFRGAREAWTFRVRAANRRIATGRNCSRHRSASSCCLGSYGVFEVTIDTVDQETEFAHGCTSS
jgi:hypothetical protein